MSFAKGKLKIARDALGKKDYAGARDAATQVLEYEPDNYNANVFLGLSLMELGEREKSEQAYRTAISSSQENPLAWQGISKFYDRAEEWEKYANTLLRLMEIYDKINDAVKCAETWQKFVELRREKGTRPQLVEALSLILPHSPFYAVLSTLPPPDLTNPTSTTMFAAQTAISNSLPVLEEIVELLEAEETDLMKKEVEKRRTRLGAGSPEVIKNEVGREIWASSKLPSFYDEIINHPSTSDDLRRSTEARLLRYKERYLHVVPSTPEFALEKESVLREVDTLVNGVVLLRIPDELAWSICLEGKDFYNVADYDHSLIKQFIRLFSSSPMASLLHGYFIYIGTPLSGEKGEDEEEPTMEVNEENIFDTMINAYSAVSNSLLATRILAEIYLHELDYENGVKTAESGLMLLNVFENNTGRRLPCTRTRFKVVIATSLVHLFPPKHHPRALRLIDDVLSQSPDNVACLMGRAYILQHGKKWKEAADLFGKVDNLLPDDLDQGLRAREEKAWCLCQFEDLQMSLTGLLDIFAILEDFEERDEDKARCLWRIGKCYWMMGDDKREEAYGHFIAALKANPVYAPAFTSLGIYYSEFSSPLDPNRASKCFQKAFELDPREGEAARRLAEGFAEDREWDLVEVVARRTIEGEGGTDVGIMGAGSAAAARYLPTNAWAWKAVGVVELNRRNYSSAIQAFQVALRAEPDDALSWLRLGEAYSKGGRHVAALKALERAHDLHPDDWMCAYLIGDVNQQMGNFSDAIGAFRSILNDRPTEVGVLASLGQAYLDLGRLELSEGFQARAEQSFVTCISVALRMIKESPGFRNIAWKTLGDAIFALSARATFLDELNIRDLLQKVASLLPAGSDQLSGFMPPASLEGAAPLTGIKTLEIAVAAYNYRLSLTSSETTARSGSTWFDLGTSLHLWVMKLPENGNTLKARDKVVFCLTQALRKEPNNSQYWLGLGDAHFLGNAKNAQHAYIKALEIDSKNHIAWTNLGLLYLYHNDFELANESLYRAQTLDPDYAIAWIGQALVATENGHDVEAMAMLEHVVGLTSNVPEGDLEFSLRTFDRLRFSRYDKNKFFEALLPAFFVLNRYCERRPSDAAGLHLFGLVCESFGHLETGVVLISRAIAILEAAYEDTEDPEVERHFTIANSNLARLRLSLRDYQGAAEAFESVLGLLSDEDEDPTTNLLRAQAQFGSGVASFKQGDLETALASFEASLESAGDNLALRGQITVLLAQTMWAIQSDEFRENSKAQLLECITADPENLAAITTLAGMGVVTEDDSLVDAALSEILALPLERRHELDPRRDVDHLLMQYHLGQEDFKKALGIAQSALFAEPPRPDVRNNLANLILRGGQREASLAILGGSTSADSTDTRDIVPTSLSLQAVAHACGDGKVQTALHEIQRAIMLSPSNIRYWEVLAFVRSEKSSGNE
ncbi:Superkiller protein 3 [Hypsizygus marmoreus]|uniref:Superkiller protein 3 n=1 Tax=Hypsizygus marmoreus TaxID=39966 RepID=A0A369JZT3_HYPMA|nr:Superkiller protein 3 [Hypsizygus marmoreus]